MKVVDIDVPELGNRSYIIHDGKDAIVIDPSRRTEEIIAKAKELKVKLKAVFETHIHNDYITGGYALAGEINVPYYVSAFDEVSFEHCPIEPDQVVHIGTLKLTAIASPGHTFSHTSYLVEDDSGQPALFSGGSLLYGAVGRPDLVSAESTPTLAKAQYTTAQLLKKRLKSITQVYPTHGFGSFCAATETEVVNVSTLKQQLQSNHAYTAKDEVTFVKELINGLDAYPAYYAYMAPGNLQGPSRADLSSPAQLSKEALLRAMHDGAAIVDMRTRKAYSSTHLLGTYNIEPSDSLATYIGWLIDWNVPLILVAETAEDVAIAHEQLSLIGRELLAGQACPASLLADKAKLGTYSLKKFSDLANNDPEVLLILDVRRKSEWEDDHVKDAINIPLHELKARTKELPDDKQIWVHCASGYRASIAASILQGSGKQVALIDDTFDSAQEKELTINGGKI